ncbi:hypothetical protein PIB30_091747 [Stylosanthes scabra]|uniref:Uncharacterized protein n=1 Tax=Stylosanthes scabra TaxID=79078 RepID=A0ABU6UWD0_9FABA|nr:hypothetical protein [Stylosanthes scabra]
MASPSAPPPPPPPPPHGEGSSKSSHQHPLEAYGIEPGTMAELYLYANNASCFEDIQQKILRVKPEELENAARALVLGYYEFKYFVENKIDLTEVEVSGLEHRLEETRQLLEISKNVPLADAIKQQPARFANLMSTPIPNRIYKDRLLWSLLPRTFGPYEHVDRLWQDVLEGKTNPRRLEIVDRSLAPAPLALRNAFSTVGPLYGMSYFQNQMRLNEVELDAARRTLREFRIFRDVHNRSFVEAYSDKTGNTTTHADFCGTTVQEGNTRKDKGKKTQKSPKKKSDK